MRLTAFFKLYKICILLHRCNLKIFAKIGLKNQHFLWKFRKKFANVAKSAKFARFQKCQLDNLVDFEKCCKTRIYLQKSVPIQPKTSNILPKFCQNWQLPYGSTTLRAPLRRRSDGPRADLTCPVGLAGAVTGRALLAISTKKRRARKMFKLRFWNTLAVWFCFFRLRVWDTH